MDNDTENWDYTLQTEAENEYVVLLLLLRMWTKLRTDL